MSVQSSLRRRRLAVIAFGLASWVTTYAQSQAPVFYPASDAAKEIESALAPDAAGRIEAGATGGLFVLTGRLRAGFEFPAHDLTVLAERDVFGEDKLVGERRTRAHAAFISDFRDLKEGDPVVHVDHGIAVYAGLGRPKGGSLNRDFMVLEFAGRGFFEVGRQNLWGSNRSVNLFTRATLRPSGLAADGTSTDFGFNEYRVLLSFRDPSVWDVYDTRLTGYFEQAVRSSFNFVRRGVLAEAARHFEPRVTVIGSYSLSTVRLFDERGYQSVTMADIGCPSAVVRSAFQKSPAVW